MKKLVKVVAIIFIVFFTMVITKEITIRSQSPIVLGDIDNNGKIDGHDVLLIKRHLEGITELGKGEFLRADMNSDRKITIADMESINKYLVGTEN